MWVSNCIAMNTEYVTAMHCMATFAWLRSIVWPLAPLAPLPRIFTDWWGRMDGGGGGGCTCMVYEPGWGSGLEKIPTTWISDWDSNAPPPPAPGSAHPSASRGQSN